MIPERFVIAYADGSRRSGTTRLGWRRAPDGGVQVIAAFPGPPEPHLSKWSRVTDRYLWTGEDEYDPFGWGVKRGSLIPDEDYWRIWNEVAYGDC